MCSEIQLLYLFHKLKMELIRVIKVEQLSIQVR